MPQRRRRLVQTVIAAAIAFADAGQALAATAAGTVISNVAQIGFKLSGVASTTRSNRVDFRVGEVIDLSVTPAPLCSRGATVNGVTAVGFRIANLGNARRAFMLGTPTVSAGSNFVVRGVFADTNNNGCYDVGIDQPIPPGGQTKELDPGEKTIIFVTGTGGGGGGGQVTIRVFTGGGTGTDGTTVIARSGGDVTGSAPVPAPLAASLVKSQTVRATDGSSDPRAGAIVTYSVEGSFTGIGIATDVAIADLIPAGTAYVPGSLTLDGAHLSDAGDGDAGRFDGAGISVALGDVAAPAIHTVSFQVKIQ